jgi:hypothetical protein
MSRCGGRVSEGSKEGGCGIRAHVDKGRTPGSEVSLDEPEFELPSPSSSESDETDGGRKVPLLRGDLEGENKDQITGEWKGRGSERVPLFPHWRWG